VRGVGWGRPGVGGARTRGGTATRAADRAGEPDAGRRAFYLRAAEIPGLDSLEARNRAAISAPASRRRRYRANVGLVTCSGPCSDEPTDSDGPWPLPLRALGPWSGSAGRRVRLWTIDIEFTAQSFGIIGWLGVLDWVFKN
jgi:hypothetical protein